VRTLNIGNFIINTKDKLEYKNFADMARTIGVSPDFLLRLSKIETKEELKQVNIESLEKVANYIGITIDELINPVKLKNTDVTKCDIKFLNECNDMEIIINELMQKAQENGIKYNGFEMNNESKQILIDSLDVVKQLVRSKI
jgi:transcriptional regulator with XRE-family HTH domain